MRRWHNTPPLMKALIFSGLLHGAFIAMLFWQPNQTALPSETAELYEMDLTPQAANSTDENDDTTATVPTEAAHTDQVETPPPAKPSQTANSLSESPVVRPRPNIPAITRRNIQDPTIIKLIDPVYPVKFTQEKPSFKITLVITILESGQVGAASVANSSEISELDKAAVAAVRQWVFSPAIDLTTGKPVPFFTTIDLSYPPPNKNAPQKTAVNP